MRGRHSDLLIISWHNIEGTWSFPARPRSGMIGFRQQCQFLRCAANVLPLEGALEAISRGEPLPPRAVALTFDDGYRDTLEVAAPILQDMQFPATCFLVPGILSGQADPWWERLAWGISKARSGVVSMLNRSFPIMTQQQRTAAFRHISRELKKLNTACRQEYLSGLIEALKPVGVYDTHEQFLDWAGARRLAEYMSIGSHSMSHSILANETGTHQFADMLSSRTSLEDGLKRQVRLLAYPNGTRSDFNLATLRAARAAGYTHAVTTEFGMNTRTTPALELRRWEMNAYRGACDFLKIARDIALHPISVRSDRSFVSSE